ncbi:MAG: AmmeMemoRadiSam system protein B [Verrucomicrobiales bacterium]|nr:AmmeMemoRadiSam system protein B [Verrucomicrobiales bacterium]
MGKTSTTRPAVQAGRFYPASPEALGLRVERLLEAGVPGEIKDPPAIIAPHAGYTYSGPIAGSAFAPWNGLSRCVTRRVVLLGPSHFVDFDGIALAPQTVWSTPLGNVEVDAAALDEMRAFSFVRTNAAAHEREHCLEVELPFLQVALGNFTIVPLVLGRVGDEEASEVLEMLWRDPSTRVVVSSDLSHYLNYDEATAMDRDTADSVEKGEIDALSSTRACGYRAIRALMSVTRRRGLGLRAVDLRNSGDTAGSRDAVVGYGAFHVVGA